MEQYKFDNAVNTFFKQLQVDQKNTAEINIYSAKNGRSHDFLFMHFEVYTLSVKVTTIERAEEINLSTGRHTLTMASGELSFEGKQIKEFNGILVDSSRRFGIPNLKVQLFFHDFEMHSWSFTDYSPNFDSLTQLLQQEQKRYKEELEKEKEKKRLEELVIFQNRTALRAVLDEEEKKKKLRKKGNDIGGNGND